MTARRKLGLKPYEPDSRDLQFRAMVPTYMASAKPVVVPSACSWRGDEIDVNLFLNNRLGCCACSAAGHQILQWCDISGKKQELCDGDILHAYSEFCGYDPEKPDSDEGGYLRDVLRGWRRSYIGGHRIDGFALVDYRFTLDVKFAHAVFGGLTVGAALPRSSRTERVWDIPEGKTPTGTRTPGSWGHHAMTLVSYDRSGVTFLTWGTLQNATWKWWRTYVRECWAVISPDWISANGFAINHYDPEALKRALEVIALLKPEAKP